VTDEGKKLQKEDQHFRRVERLLFCPAEKGVYRDEKGNRNFGRRYATLGEEGEKRKISKYLRELS